MQRTPFALAAIAALGLLAGPAHAQSGSSTDERIEDARKRAEEGRRHAAEYREQQKDKRGEDEGGDEFTERIVKTFNAGDRPTVVLANIAGDVKISGASGAETKVEAIKRVRARSEADAQRQFEATRVDVEEHAGRVEARTSYTGGKNRVSVDYIVSAPVLAMVDVRSVSGDIVIQGVKGEVRAETVSGDIAATGLARESTLKAVSGDVNVSSSAVDGELGTSSVSGNVVVKGFKARSVNAVTVSGDVMMQSASCERVLARSVSGNVMLEGSLAKGGRYEFKSHSGDIKLVMDGKTGFEIDASSFSGRIKSEVPLTVRSTSGGEEHGHPNRRLEGVFGDGSAQIEVATFSGNVIIAKSQ
jgi:DUF4097 and DUF4098 domain-containing protein YvlB